MAYRFAPGNFFPWGGRNQMYEGRSPESPEPMKAASRSSTKAIVAAFVFCLIAIGFMTAFVITFTSQPSTDSTGNNAQQPACDGDPCTNGATCLDQNDDFVCLCPKGKTGKTCNEDSGLCSEYLCGIGGICIEGLNNFVCVCPPGKTGKICTEDLGLCNAATCSNGGTCSMKDNDIECDCPPGKTGKFCDEDPGPCSTDICENGGSCFEGTNDFICQCPQGKTGRYCDEDLGLCSAATCSNGGTCSEQNNQIVCDCPPGKTGKFCDEDPGPCSADICNNGGSCFEGNGDFFCQCPPEKTGRYCDEDEGCLHTPCANGGTCSLDNAGANVCTCPDGLSGDFCEIREWYCTGPITPCGQYGTCNEVSNEDLPNHKYVCSCDDGWTGTNCDEQDWCSSNPCNNGGVCTNTQSSYQCACTVPHVTINDRCDYDQCTANSPCQNGGTCISNPDGSYSCACVKDILGATGPDCETLFCEDGWYHGIWTDSCYRIIPNSLDGDTARQTCDVLGTSLVSVQTSMEEAALFAMLAHGEFDQAGCAGYWTSANRPDTSTILEEFYWDLHTGQTQDLRVQSWTHWKQNQPDNVDHNCMAMAASDGLRWTDRSCTDVNFCVICERPPQ